MGLRTKFNLILCLVTAIGLGLAGYFGDQLLKKNAREQVIQSAQIMMESAAAVRTYTANEVRPLIAAQEKIIKMAQIMSVSPGVTNTDNTASYANGGIRKTTFIPQTVPAYSASKYIAALQQEHPHYTYKEATLNPTNPENRAMAWEEDIISYFRANRGEHTFVGERDTPIGRALFLSQPITVSSPKCLHCHGSASEAPTALIETYGSANGFGWKLDEIIGAQIVSVPMALPLKHADAAFTTFMTALLLIFLFIIILMNILLNYFVIRPVRLISENAEAVSMGALDVKELPVKGNDEIASLGHSFNRMQRSLNSAVKMLDETLD